MSTNEPAPDSRNVPGDFYVAHGCCLLCSVPWRYAPELFDYDDRGCWVARHPAGQVDHERMMQVVRLYWNRGASSGRVVEMSDAAEERTIQRASTLGVFFIFCMFVVFALSFTLFAPDGRPMLFTSPSLGRSHASPLHGVAVPWSLRSSSSCWFGCCGRSR